MFRIQVMANGIDKAAREVAHLDKKILQAKKRGLNKTVKAMQTLVRREVAAQTGIAQKHLKQYNRIKARTSQFNNYAMGEFWMGTNPMPSHTAKGRAKQEDWGVKQGDYLFEGAFYRAVFGSQPKIWFRKKSRAARLNVAYNKKRRSRQSAWQRQNNGRFPVVLAGIAIADQANKAFKKSTPEVMSQFEKRVMHEIKRELKK